MNEDLEDSDERKVFMFAGYTTLPKIKEKEELMQKIALLGGDVDGSPNWDQNCTHVIADKYELFTGKVLAALASGKWVVTRRFVDRSHKRGSWSNSKPFVCDQTVLLHRKRWFENGGCFRGMKVLFLMENEMKRNAYTDVVKAGGGSVLDNWDIDQLLHFKPGPSELTHIVVDPFILSERDHRFIKFKKWQEYAKQVWDPDRGETLPYIYYKYFFDYLSAPLKNVRPQEYSIYIRKVMQIARNCGDLKLPERDSNSQPSQFRPVPSRSSILDSAASKSTAPRLSRPGAGSSQVKETLKRNPLAEESSNKRPRTEIKTRVLEANVVELEDSDDDIQILEQKLREEEGSTKRTYFDLTPRDPAQLITVDSSVELSGDESERDDRGLSTDDDAGSVVEEIPHNDVVPKFPAPQPVSGEDSDGGSDIEILEIASSRPQTQVSSKKSKMFKRKLQEMEAREERRRKKQLKEEQRKAIRASVESRGSGSPEPRAPEDLVVQAQIVPAEEIPEITGPMQRLSLENPQSDDDEALAEIVRYEPEWFCPPCLAEKPRRNSSTSFLQASSRSGGLDSPSDPVETTETKCSNIDVGARHAKCVEYEIILPFTGPDPEDRVEVAARPGKNWRRSIMTNLTNGLNISLGRRTSMAGPRMSSVHREANINSEFTAPELPINDRRSSKRLSSRVSSITTRHTHYKSQLQELSEEAELDGVPRCLRADPERSILNRGPRPNFYIVPNTLPHDLDESAGEAHTSILVQPGTSELEKLLACCSVNKIVAFDEVYDANSLLHSRKIGEGAFGEVFLVGSETVDKPVLKVVPIGGSIKVNDEEQTRLADMMSEVVISSSLSNLRFGKNNFTEGFVEVRKCIVFQGEYPVQLLNLWDEFDLEKRSENTRPDYLPRDQLYMALEFNNGGKDLEKYEFRNASQALAAWKQVAHTLAVAEAALNFEHRDLHWGNVLIKETARKKVNYQISGQNYSVETNGVEITIIDFSLSRLRSGEDSCTIFKNLAEDPTLFTALGLDRGGDYQFDIYRLMRKENGNNWENFHPKTNIFWLHYMLEKMMTEVYYKGKKNSKPHKSGLALMRSVKGSLLEFNSARDWVTKEGVLVLN